MATTVEEVERESQYLLDNVLAGNKFELPIYFDIEDSVHKNLSKTHVTEITKAYLSYLESKGQWVGIYSSKSFLEIYLTEEVRNRYALWVTQWNTELTYTAQCGMWQFGGETNYIRPTKINEKTVDQNYMLEDYPTLIKNRGKNGYGSNDFNIKPQEPEKLIKNYTVANGDNLSSIAAKQQKIAEINGLSDPNKIYLGQSLKIK